MRLALAASTLALFLTSAASADSGGSPCGFRYLAHGGGGKTLLSCGAGDLVQRVAAAPGEMRPLPGEYASAAPGEVLFTETARVAVTWGVLSQSGEAVLADGAKVAFEAGEKLRIYEVGGRNLFCRIDTNSATAEERQILERRRGPFAGLPYAAVCLDDPGSTGAFTRAMQRPLGSARFTATAVKPIPYDLRTEHHVATAEIDGGAKPIAMALKLVSASPDEVRIAFPALSDAARATFSRSGLPLRKDKTLTIPLIDGAGAVTERGLTIRIVASTAERVDYVVTGRINDWFGIE